MEIEDKIVVITGGTKGLGKALASCFLKNGAKVIVCSRDEKVALAQMRKQDFGLIINILSTSALDGKINETAYCSSKFAAMGFTKSLKKEVDGQKIKVYAVYPGGMRTNLFDEKKPENYTDFMDPNDVASRIVENLKKEISEEELIIKR
jgi:short-subunit dehydrogenase